MPKARAAHDSAGFAHDLQMYGLRARCNLSRHHLSASKHCAKILWPLLSQARAAASTSLTEARESSRQGPNSTLLADLLQAVGNISLSTVFKKFSTP